MVSANVTTSTHLLCQNYWYRYCRSQFFFHCIIFILFLKDTDTLPVINILSITGWWLIINEKIKKIYCKEENIVSFLTQEVSLKGGKEEKEKLSCNGVEMIREYLSPVHTEEDKYVYDVYYTEGNEDSTADFDDSMLDSLGKYFTYLPSTV